LHCETVKAGLECVFMTKSGCGFNGGSCHEIVENCEGCDRILDLPSGKYCRTYPDPALKWKNGRCNFATHVKTGSGKTSVKINPLKASKRSTRRR